MDATTLVVGIVALAILLAASLFANLGLLIAGGATNAELAEAHERLEMQERAMAELRSQHSRALGQIAQDRETYDRAIAEARELRIDLNQIRSGSLRGPSVARSPYGPSVAHGATGHGPATARGCDVGTRSAQNERATP